MVYLQEGYIPINERDKAKPETIKINKSKYSVPSYGEVELTVSASVLLSDTARITFVNENNNRIDAELFNVGNNTYKGDIKINQYANVGKYKLATIRLYRQDNKEPYYYVYTNDLGDKYDQNAKTGDLELDLEFEVYANNTPDVITGTQAENLLESIKNAKDDAIIYVDATNDSIIKKEVFEAIKDTNKELHIESSGIEWIFKGKDIINPKQIDTSISVLFDYNYNKTNMKDYIDKSVVILFKDNGELPGISTIRIKLDYVFRSYIGNKIYVYYYDENSKFEDVTGKELQDLSKELEREAEHSSLKERNAIECERDVEDMKMAEYMQDHIGEEFDAKVAGVVPSGMFVRLENMVEGRVHVGSMKGDYYIVDEVLQMIIGKKSGKKYRLGDTVRVKCTDASKVEGTIDFELVGGNNEKTEEK